MRSAALRECMHRLFVLFMVFAIGYQSFSAVTYFSYPADAAPRLFTATASANASGAVSVCVLIEPTSTYFHFPVNNINGGTRIADSNDVFYSDFVDASTPQCYLNFILVRSMKAKQSRLRRSLLMVLLILLAEGIEPNPGPIQFGFLNVQSAVRKAALVHDLISSYGLDMFALSETWIVDEDSDAVKRDIAPAGYLVLNTHRPGATASTRGGGLALIYRDNIKIRACNKLITQEISSFEFQIFDCRCGKVKLLICNIYRPPHGSTGLFYEQFTDFLEIISSKAGYKFLLCGDFNCPGTNSCINNDLDSLFNCLDLTQHVTGSTRNSNLLDLLISASSCYNMINNVRLHESGLISDHRLITCELDAPTPEITATTSSYRDLRSIDIDEFSGSVHEFAGHIGSSNHSGQLHRSVAFQCDWHPGSHGSYAHQAFQRTNEAYTLVIG